MPSGQKNGGKSPTPSPSRSVRGREWSEATFAGDARDGTKPVIPAPAGIQRKTKHAALPSPFCGAKGERAERSETQGVHNPVIPAKAGIQRGEGAGPDDQSPNLDVEAARKSMTRMANIFADIAKHAEDSSLTRCPYKDARSRCTAKFGCRNQHFTKNPLNPPICTAKDGDLDYRSAWEI